MTARAIKLKEMTVALPRTPVLLLILVSFFLTACVTETTGGFNVEVNEERAVQNYLQLSMGYLSENDLVSSRRHLNNAMELDPNNGEAYGVWGLLYSVEGDVGLADESFRRSLRIDPSNSQVRNNYAAFLFANARFKEAYEELERVVEDTEYANRAQAFENMGMAALQLNDSKSAEYAFRRALQLSSNQIQSTLALADINLRTGTTPQASNYYASFLTMVQFYNIEQTANSLWVGIRLEQALGDQVKVAAYADILAEKFPNSVEYASYQQSLDTP